MSEEDWSAPDEFNPFTKFTAHPAKPLSDAQWSAVTTFLTRASLGQAEFLQEKTEKGRVSFGGFLSGWIWRVTNEQFCWFLTMDSGTAGPWTGGGDLQKCACDLLRKMFDIHVEHRARRHYAFATAFLYEIDDEPESE